MTCVLGNAEQRPEHFGCTWSLRDRSIHTCLLFRTKSLFGLEDSTDSMPKMWDSSDRKFTQTSIPAAQKVSYQKFMLDNRIMPNSVLIKDEYYKTSQIMAMFSCTVSSLRRNLNQKNRLEDNGLLYRSPSAWKIIELIFAIRDFLSEISAKFLKISNREISWKFRFTKVEDQDTAIILKWPEMVAVVLVLTLLLGGGQGPTPELWFCLWLSFIQITESCIWEPW